MYSTNAKGKSYSNKSIKAGKKTDEVKIGCLVIEHVPTGKFIASASKSVSADVGVVLQNLPPKMQALCKHEDDLRVYEYSTKTVREAEKVLREIKDSVEPKYLFLGDNSLEKKPCPVKVKSKPAPCAVPPTTKSSRTKSVSPKT
jgi:hypothetical protein